MTEPSISALLQIAAVVLECAVAYVQPDSFRFRDDIRKLARLHLREFSSETIELLKELGAVKVLAYLANDRRYCSSEGNKRISTLLPWFYRKMILPRYDRSICWITIGVSGGWILINSLAEVGISIELPFLESVVRPLMMALIVMFILQIGFVFLEQKNKKILTNTIEENAEELAKLIRILMIQAERNTRNKWTQ